MTTTKAIDIPDNTICRRCDYALRGLTLDANCPECGMSIEESLRPFTLALAPTKYLRQLHRGALIMGLSLLAFLAVCLLAAAPTLYRIRNGLGGQDVGMNVLSVGLPLTMIGFFVGVWIFSSTPSRLGNEEPPAPRYVARCSLILMGLAVFLFFAGRVFGIQNFLFGIFGPAVLFLLASSVSLFLSMQAYIMWLAERIPNVAIQNSASAQRLFGAFSIVCIVISSILMIDGSTFMAEIAVVTGPIGLLIALIVTCLWLLNLNRLRKQLRRLIKNRTDEHSRAYE